MSTPAEEPIVEVLARAPDERSAVATVLPESLDGEDEAIVANAGAEEIGKRRADLRDGTARAHAWSEARARLSALY